MIRYKSILWVSLLGACDAPPQTETFNPRSDPADIGRGLDGSDNSGTNHTVAW
jgi:hypothetical protein